MQYLTSKPTSHKHSRLRKADMWDVTAKAILMRLPKPLKCIAHIAHVYPDVKPGDKVQYMMFSLLVFLSCFDLIVFCNGNVYSLPLYCGIMYDNFDFYKG